MLDGEETVAILKLKDGLDRLHQSKMRCNVNKGPCFLFILWYYGQWIWWIICKCPYVLFVDSTDPPSPSITVHFFRLCWLWDAAKDWRKCRLLAWKDQIGQRKDKPLPGGNCKDLNITTYSRLYSLNFCRKISGTRRDCGGLRSPQGISGKNTEV